ncbi:MAG: alpha-galactosidase [Candidatus Hydrogenedentota bacterium]
MSIRNNVCCITFAAIIMLCGCAMGPIYRPGREYRTINAAEYEIAMQKNGRVDVLLRSGQVVLANAQPMVWYADEKGLEPLAILGRNSIRDQVNDRLGQGQGVVFKRKECEWAIRVYPDKPFFTCQVAFVNNDKKPVKIRALSPWFLGESNNGALSFGAEAESTIFLQNPSAFPGPPEFPSVTTGSGSSLWYLAGFNPISRQSLLAGFLTSDTGYGTVMVDRTEKAEPPLFNQFQAVNYYDPPVEVPPGGTLESEVFYIAVAERTPIQALDRYGHAVAAVNQVPLRKPPLPHGTTALAQPRGKVSELAVLEEAAVLEKDLLRYGWDTVTIGAGWEKAPGVWEPGEKAFPRGFAPLVNELHKRGMKVSLFLNPFVVPAESPLTSNHPDWLAPVAPWAQSALPENAHILDVTVPGADEYLRELFMKVSHTWGFDAVEGLDIAYGVLAAESYKDPSLTRQDVLRLAMSAVKQGMGTGKTISSIAPEQGLCVRTDVAELKGTIAPLWEGNETTLGCVDAIDAATFHYFYSPYLYAPSLGAAYFDTPALSERWPELQMPSLTKDQSIAWLTATAINGGVLKIGNPFSELDEEQQDVLKKLLPTLSWPARPVDLFENTPPSIWSARLRTKAGEWFYAAVFNWSTTEELETTLYFGELGMGPESVYTVYDFWDDRYFGLAQGQLNVQVAPGSVRLLGFRLYEKHPLLVASTRHFTQGAIETKALKWDAAQKELRGEAKVIPDTDYGLRILVPEPFTVSEAAVSGIQPHLDQKGDILEVNFHNQNAEEIRWYVRF